MYETTVKPRRYEFPRRTVRPNANSLPQQAALIATTTPFIDIEDNHSDEVRKFWAVHNFTSSIN